MESKVLGRSAFVAALLFSPFALAVTEQQCFDAYASAAHTKNMVGVPMQYGGLGLTLGGTTGGIVGAVQPEITGVAILGGSSVASTGDSLVADAEFAGNVAQTVAEARAKVVGPYATQLAADLNDAVYDSGRFAPQVKDGHVQYSSPLNDETKAQLSSILNGRKISADQLASATGLLLQSGGLCKVDGNTLGQDEWARLIVTYVAQKAR